MEKYRSQEIDIWFPHQRPFSSFPAAFDHTAQIKYEHLNFEANTFSWQLRENPSAGADLVIWVKASEDV